MAGRRIILLLDGTWNDADFENNDTNIVRLRDIIADSLGSEPAGTQSPRSFAAKPKYDGIEYIVFYERGVGTDTSLNQFLGGAFGEGLDVNIRRAYRVLSFHYEHGDEIFIFGFSRGSYTARSLVGYISAAGLLRAGHCTEENERIAWDYYRAAPSDRIPGEWHKLTQYIHDRDHFRIEFIGVFDTVGALGVPSPWFQRANRQKYEFHNVELSSITNVNLHALAIDERRWPFQASVWRKPPFKVLETATEQVWFAGAHANIGGGAVDARFRTRQKPELDDITLDWMIKRLTHHYQNPKHRFPVSAWVPLKDTTEAFKAMQNQPRRSYYRLYPYAWRSIGNIEVQLKGWESFFTTCVSFDRHDAPINEMIHISAIERLACPVSLDGRKIVYRPKNLVDTISRLKEIYKHPPGQDTPATGQMLLVDWDGRILHAEDPTCRHKAISAIQQAEERLAKARKE